MSGYILQITWHNGRHPTRAASFPTTLTPPVTLLQFIAQPPVPGPLVCCWCVRCHDTLTGQHDTCNVMVVISSQSKPQQSIKCKYDKYKGDVNGGTKRGGSRQQGGTSWRPTNEWGCDLPRQSHRQSRPEQERFCIHGGLYNPTVLWNDPKIQTADTEVEVKSG